MRPPEEIRPVRTGVWMFPSASVAATVDAVTRAEELGLDEVWLADEGVSRDPMVMLAAAAGETARIRLAVGVTSPVLRHPGALAATAATIDELSGGRFTLGLGVGGSLALGPLGLSTDKPVAVLREAIATARAVLSGRRGDGYEPVAHAIDPRPVPIWVGGRGPQIVALAARLADGVFISGCTSEQQDSIVAIARSAEPSVGLALYRSALEEPRRASEVAWDRIGPVLEREASRISPTSVGINLVDLNEGGRDPVELVERAAAVLSTLALPRRPDT